MNIRLPWRRYDSPALASSKLYDDQTFYPAFLRDLHNCRELCIIESPFISHKRMNALYPSFRRLTKRGVRVVINTRDPREHEPWMRGEAQAAVDVLQAMEVEVLYTEKHHRKLAILDCKLLYEGSLNILSQNDSCEVMRRIDSPESTNQMIGFLRLDRFL